MEPSLTREEDAELRRLAALAAYGELGDQAAALYADLRARDRRLAIREPEDVVVAAGLPASAPSTRRTPASDASADESPAGQMIAGESPVTMAG